jgi:hypothetical protein
MDLWYVAHNQNEDETDVHAVFTSEEAAKKYFDVCIDPETELKWHSYKWGKFDLVDPEPPEQRTYEVRVDLFYKEVYKPIFIAPADLAYKYSKESIWLVDAFQVLKLVWVQAHNKEGARQRAKEYMDNFVWPEGKKDEVVQEWISKATRYCEMVSILLSEDLKHGMERSPAAHHSWVDIADGSKNIWKVIDFIKSMGYDVREAEDKAAELRTMVDQYGQK